MLLDIFMHVVQWSVQSCLSVFVGNEFRFAQRQRDFSGIFGVCGLFPLWLQEKIVADDDAATRFSR